MTEPQERLTAALQELHDAVVWHGLHRSTDESPAAYAAFDRLMAALETARNLLADVARSRVKETV